MRVLLVLVMMLWAARCGAATLEQEWAAWQKGFAAHGLELKADIQRPEGDKYLLLGVKIRPQDRSAPDLAVNLERMGFYRDARGSLVLEPFGALEARWRPTGSEGHLWMPTHLMSMRLDSFENGYRLYVSASKQEATLSLRGPAFAASGQGQAGLSSFGLNLTLDRMDLRWSDLAGVADIRNLAVSADRMVYRYNYRLADPDLFGTGRVDSRDTEIFLNLKTPIFPNWKGTTPLALLTEALGDGLDARLRWSDQGSSVTQEDRTPAGLKRLQASYLSQSLDLGVSKAGMDLGFAMAGGAVQASDPRSAPTEGHYTVGPVRAQVHAPLLGEGALPFALDLSIKDLGLPPEIEGQFDPEGRLPRGPLALSIDMSGMIRDLNLPYLADPVAALNLGRAPQAESLVVRELAVSGFGSGAALAGNLTMEGLAQPNPTLQGQAEARLTGAHRMMDFLQSRGLISPDQNLGFRMLAASSFDPVDDQADELVSQIDARPDGSLFINGARMR